MLPILTPFEVGVFFVCVEKAGKQNLANYKIGVWDPKAAVNLWQEGNEALSEDHQIVEAMTPKHPQGFNELDKFSRYFLFVLFPPIQQQVLLLPLIILVFDETIVDRSILNAAAV